MRPAIERLGKIYSVAGEGASGYLRGLKCAMSVAGICSDDLTVPFRTVNDRDRAAIGSIVESLDLKKSNLSSAGVGAGT